jgi:hypothetical protein
METESIAESHAYLKSFPKISRYSRPAIITEKIDGTCVAIVIARAETVSGIAGVPQSYCLSNRDGLWMLAKSKNRWIKPDNDHFHFANWASCNYEELWGLGEGTHYGEWWGCRMNKRDYGIKHRNFSLFNVQRWFEHGTPTFSESNAIPELGEYAQPRSAAPKCCKVVPILNVGSFDECGRVPVALERLKRHGSVAQPGYMDPEGIVICHVASGTLFKKTIHKDEVPKGKANAR